MITNRSFCHEKFYLPFFVLLLSFFTFSTAVNGDALRTSILNTNTPNVKQPIILAQGDSVPDDSVPNDTVPGDTSSMESDVQPAAQDADVQDTEPPSSTPVEEKTPERTPEKTPEKTKAQPEVRTEVPEEKGEPILDVIIEGNRRILGDVILNNITSGRGVKFSPRRVKEDLRIIYGMGYFDDVKAEIEKTPDGLILIYTVSEKPVVVDVRIRGNKEIDTDDIEEIVLVEEGRIIDVAKLNKTVSAIKKLYSSKGYVNYSVEAEVEPKAEGTVSVIFEIEDGKKAFIKKVRIVGNEKLKSKKIKKGLYSRPKWFLSSLTHRGLYNSEEIERDTDRIRSKYLEEGFIDAKVSKPEVAFDEEHDGFIVTFRVEEGTSYTINNISFSGDVSEPDAQDIRARLKLNTGGTFSASLLSHDLTSITVYYGDKGYAFANVEPKFQKNRETSLLDITYIVERGQEIFVRNIDILGNTRTRDKVIRREIPINEQERYNSTKIQAIQPRVFRLGFFDEKVEIETERVAGEENQIDVRVRVVEKPTGFFSIAGGFSSVETVIFAAQVQESNLFGYGKRLSLSVQIGGVTRLFILNYQDPNFLDSEYVLDVIVFNTDRVFRDFDRESFGGNLSLGRRIWRNLSARVAYRFESVKVGQVEGNARLIITESRNTISAFGAGLIWDTRNNLLDPTKGLIARTFIEFGGSYLAGNTDFTKFTASARYFYPLPYKNTLALSGRYGVIDLRNTGDDLVVSERFFLGGPDSLRGFKFRRVGARVPTDDGDFVIIGGTQQVLFSADWIIPISQALGLKGTVFFDIGNVFNDDENLSLSPSDLRKDFGFGFRWISPLGPLRLEFGIPIGEKLSGEDNFEVQFTIGNLF